MKPQLTVIDGQRDDRKVVCTWCAGCFLSQAELKKHWRESPKCKRNKMVNNQLQSKYGDANLIVAQPGEDVLNLTRAADCTHATTKNLLDSGGYVIGRQCMYCYTQLPPLKRHPKLELQ